MRLGIIVLRVYYRPIVACIKIDTIIIRCTAVSYDPRPCGLRKHALEFENWHSLFCGSACQCHTEGLLSLQFLKY